jgi:hypothetical protein
MTLACEWKRWNHPVVELLLRRGDDHADNWERVQAFGIGDAVTWPSSSLRGLR